MSESCEELFALLEVPRQQSMQVRTTGVELPGGEVAVALNPQGRPVVLVPAPGRKARSVLVTRGLSARVGPLLDAGASQDWLMITCQTRHLDGTFYRLCDDLILHLDGLDPADDAVDRTLAVVQRWQNLLAAAPVSLLTDQQCAGLLAELHVLEALVEQIGSAEAMKSWVGHDRSRVDFRFADCGIEVKATLKRDRFVVTIHGLLQLDDVGIGDLFLFGQQMERTPSGGDSIPLAIRRLVRAGVSEPALRDALASSGYATADEQVYEQVCFETLDERGVHVGDGTPRIVKSTFADPSAAEAVSALAYAIDLTDLQPGQGRLEEAREVFLRVQS